MKNPQFGWRQWLLIGSVIALSGGARPAMAQITMTTTITSVNGQDPSPANLSVSGAVRVGVRITFDPAICDPTIHASLFVYDTYTQVDSVTEAVSGRVTEWNATLVWNTQNSPLSDGGCRNKAELVIISGADGAVDDPMMGDCSLPVTPDQNSERVAVKVGNQTPGCCPSGGGCGT
jgi:hypothetical protein